MVRIFHRAMLNFQSANHALYRKFLKFRTKNQTGNINFRQEILCFTKLSSFPKIPESAASFDTANVWEFLARIESAPHVYIYLHVKTGDVGNSHGSKTKVQAALCFIHLAKGRCYANL